MTAVDAPAFSATWLREHHRREPLDDAQRAELRRILDAAKAVLG